MQSSVEVIPSQPFPPTALIEIVYPVAERPWYL